jgi:cobalt-zinc-cadmium efflux system protein
LTSGKATLTVHLVINESVDGESDVMLILRERLAKEFGLHHVTVQCERVSCRAIESADHFAAT